MNSTTALPNPPPARTVHKTFSFARVGAIAGNTLLELVRLKVFYFLLLFALLVIGSSAFMVNFSFQEQFQVLKDVSLGSMSIFTWLLAVLSTAMLLPKDIEDRTLYTILAKPVPRFEYLLGKLLGVLLLLLVATLLMSAMFAGALYLRQQMVVSASINGATPEQAQEAITAIHAQTFTASLLPGVAAIYLKAALCAAVTLFISTFATSWIFTILISVMVYFIGHIQSTAREYWLATGDGSQIAKIFMFFVTLIFPDLQLFNLVDDIVAGNAIQMLMFWKTVGLGVSYLGVYLLAAYFVFANKEL
ncbi:MAG: ABC transporter permease subunit [Verrucomicrobiota bacterium]